MQPRCQRYRGSSPAHLGAGHPAVFRVAPSGGVVSSVIGHPGLFLELACRLPRAVGAIRCLESGASRIGRSGGFGLGADGDRAGAQRGQGARGAAELEQPREVRRPASLRRVVVQVQPSFVTVVSLPLPCVPAVPEPCIRDRVKEELACSRQRRRCERRGPARSVVRKRAGADRARAAPRIRRVRCRCRCRAARGSS